MHYNCVFLVNADNFSDSLKKTDAFLSQFQDKNFDYYSYGGRWTWDAEVEKHKGKIPSVLIPALLSDKKQEVIDAKHPDFFKVISEMKEATEQEKVLSAKVIAEAKKGSDKEYVAYSEKRLKNLEKPKTWIVEIHFWNITDNSYEFDKQKILKNAKNWFLVNCDIHA